VNVNAHVTVDLGGTLTSPYILNIQSDPVPASALVGFK
jgi:hypothetical protein